MLPEMVKRPALTKATGPEEAVMSEAVMSIRVPVKEIPVEELVVMVPAIVVVPPPSN